MKIVILALALAGCGGVADPTPAPDCVTYAPAHGIDAACGPNGYVQLVQVCRQDHANPWWNRTDMSCAAEGFDLGALWCCVGDGPAAQP